MRAACLLLLLVAAGAARAAPVAVVHAALGKPGEQLQATLVNTGDAHTEDLAIDVSRDFQDRLGDEERMQVNLTLRVIEGAAHVNGLAVPSGVVSALRVQAKVVQLTAATSEVSAVRLASVLVHVHVEEQFAVDSTGNKIRQLRVQETVREVDTVSITEFEVQEAIVDIDEKGMEVRRVVGQIAMASSHLADPSSAVPVAPKPTAVPEDAPLPTEDQPSEEDKVKSACHKFRNWYHHLPFWARVGVSAGVVVGLFFAFCLLWFALRVCVSCFCPTPVTATKKRTVYLDNIQIQYAALPMYEHTSVTKKPSSGKHVTFSH